MEKHWTAQLASFDFEIKYRSGRSTHSADALSGQNLMGVEEVQDLCPGVAVPALLQQAARAELRSWVNQIALFPCYSLESCWCFGGVSCPLALKSGRNSPGQC